MGDDWERYDRDLAEYHRRIDAIERAAGRYGRVSRPRPPSPPARPRERVPRSPGALTIVANDESGRDASLSQEARRVLAQLIEAATGGDGHFVIVRPNGSKPIVAKRQFRAEVDGRALLELERADLLWADSRDGAGRLKTFDLSPAPLGLLNAALPVAGESGPLVAGSPQPPGEGNGALNASQSPPRQRGRPKGTRSVPRDQIVETFRALRASYGRNPTQVELAANLEPRIEPRTLKAHLRDYGLPWPLE